MFIDEQYKPSSSQVDKMSKVTLVDFEQHMPDYLALLNATRKLGHSVESAIADLIDNGLDAQATDVHVYFTEEQRTEKQVRNDGRSIISISIVDNGTGMNKFQLHKALIPASTGRVRNTKTQSGFFGMGLLASGLALGNHIDVFTRGEDGDLYSHIDWDEKMKHSAHADNHINASRLCTSNESAKLTNYLGANETGTMIVISKLKTEPDKALDMIRKVRHHLATVFYHKRDCVNLYTYGLDNQFKSNKVIWYDYLEAEDAKETSPVFEYLITKDSNGNKCNEKVTLQMSWIHQSNKKREFTKLQRPSDAMQGGLLVRNNRGLSKGAMLGIYEKTPINNPFRWVLTYDGGILDDYVFDMNVQKDDCTILHKELKNWIKGKLSDFQSIHQSEDNARREKNRQEKELQKVEDLRNRISVDAPQKPAKLHPVLFELKSLNVDELSGRQALEKLYEFKALAEN
jgi:hypothetical protein